jgi:hypothetical protein
MTSSARTAVRGRELNWEFCSHARWGKHVPPQHVDRGNSLESPGRLRKHGAWPGQGSAGQHVGDRKDVGRMAGAAVQSPARQAGVGGGSGSPLPESFLGQEFPDLPSDSAGNGYRPARVGQGNLSPARIASPGRIAGQCTLLLGCQVRPAALGNQSDQLFEVMGFREVDPFRDERGLQVLLHALLRVKAHRISRALLPELDRRAAFLRSFSAFATHSRTTASTFSRSGIQHSPFSGSWALDRPWDFLAPPKVLRRRDNDVLGNAELVKSLSNLDLRGALRAANRHDD